MEFPNHVIRSTRRLTAWATLSLCLSVLAPSTAGQSVQAPEKDNSVQAQLKSFEIADGYQTNLFADETNGIANPVCFRWDPAGRLWVLCTWAYPQQKPAGKADDKLLILEDLDRDGRADKTSVFARGLVMPTGFALGDGGVYIGQGTDLLFLKDTDADGKADTKRVVLTGFGTGDTHQNINSFEWSPGGELMFCQGLHNFSRVETPWGIVRGDEAGVWRLRTRRLRLQTFMMPNMCALNPWGINYGRWGEMYVKSNDPPLTYTSPAMVPIKRHLSIRQTYGHITRTFGKSMAIDIVETKHLPDDLQGQAVIAGYFSHIVSTVPLKDQGAGIAKTEPRMLLRSSHRSFRPVDVKIGPQGDIYIADWFNPIIGHYQASFRHPDRDTTHGRIWRIVAKGRPLVKPIDLSKMTADQLCRMLESDERWVRYQAKRRLADLPTDQAVIAVNQWIAGLDKRAATESDIDHHLYEAIGVFEAHEKVNRALLERMLKAEDHRARAYATRVIGRSQDRLKSPLDLLNQCATDPSPRVRMEAVVAASQVPDPRAMVIASKVSTEPMDPFIHYALTQAVHALSPHWLSALRSGNLQFENPSHLIFVLQAFGGKNIAAQVRPLLQNTSLSRKGRDQLLELLARVGNATDVRYVFDEAIKQTDLLPVLARVARIRPTRPQGEIHTAIGELLNHKQPEVRQAAVQLTGWWRIKQLSDPIKAIVDDDTSPVQLRASAITALALLAPDQTAKLRRLINKDQAVPVQLAALQALAQHDLNTAMSDALKLLSQMDTFEQIAPILIILMQRQGAAGAMTTALTRTKVSADQAKLITRWLSAAGQGDAKLMAALQSLMGLQPGRPIAYSADLVAQLVKDIRQSGDAKAGQKVFTSSMTSCIACHRVKGLGKAPAGFAKGPELTTVGAGLPLELIIESVIWPKRQIKEGFESTNLLLNDGRVILGYVTGLGDGSVTVRDLSTGQVMQIASDQIERQIKAGTAMPEGLTQMLTRKELVDLLRYLSERKAP